MKTYEEFLKKAISMENEHHSVNCMPISSDDRMIVDVLFQKGLIKDVRYIGQTAVGFDLTYEGLHYFD